MSIEAKNLTRIFEFYEKREGFFGSVQALFHRKKLFTTAVDHVNFSIKEGEIVGFLGPNGAGKTTTLKMLSGILHPSEGGARVLGFDPSLREKAYQKQFAFVMGQKSQLVNDLPAREAFRLNQQIYDVPEKEYRKTLDELVELLDVGNCLDRNTRKLSLGQRMKCELIAALLHQPKVLFLDEPTIGLDVVAQKNIRDFIKRYNREKKITVILTSHYMEDIRELCERVIIINLGSVIYDGNLEDLIRAYAPHKVLKLTFDAPVSGEMLRPFGVVKNSDSFSATLLVPRAEAKRTAASLLGSQIPIDDIVIDEEDIDTVIREIFSARKSTDLHLNKKVVV